MPQKLVVHGHYMAEFFDYVSLYAKGCSLGIECYPLRDVRNFSINFLSAKPNPSLDEGNDEVVTYITDQTYYRFFDPEIMQDTNIFF